LVFSLLDELDHVATDGRQRRGFDRKLEEMEAADEAWVAYRNEQETEVAAEPVSQGDIEEEPRPKWCEFAGEASGFTPSTSPPNLSRPATAGRPDETDPERERETKILLDGEPQSDRSWVARSQAGHDMEGNGRGAMGRPMAASALSEVNEQGLKTESERRFLTISRKVPNEKEQHRIAEQAEMDRQRRAYESVTAYVKAFAEKHGYEFRDSQCSDRPENVPSPLSEGKSQGIINSHPEEGPNKRALRARYEKLAAAEREEAARKAALAAKRVPLTPPPENIETGEPEPLPDYAIWMRGQQAAP
jgi:hypothetical protein